MRRIEGRAHVLGRAVDTDVIAPGSAADFYGLDAEAERALLVERAFRAIDPAYAARVALTMLSPSRKVAGGAE